MKHKYLLALMAIPFIMACNNNAKTNQDGEDFISKARAIHDKVITLDTHCDFDVDNFQDDNNYTQDLSSQVTLPKMEKGGLDVAWFIVYTGQDTLSEAGYEKAYKQAMAKFEAIDRLTKVYAPDKIALALTSDEVREIHKSGKKVAMIGVENGYPLATDLSRVKQFYDLGARYMSLAHNGHSQLSDSNTGESDGVWLHNGLSELGKQAVVEMNKYGMMIDVSHPSKEAMRDMLAITKAPLIASHSSARALCDHSRNLDDEQLEWIKENGGVVQTVAFAAYVHSEKAKNFAEQSRAAYDAVAKKENFTILSYPEIMALSDADRNTYRQKYNDIRNQAKPAIDSLHAAGVSVNVADFVDHIDYIVNKIGIDHVGISSDFDGGGGIYGWNDASETFNVTLELVKRGYTEKEIEKLWSGNLLRVLDEVQQVAKKIQAEEA